jgi:hypothetical protein
MTMTTTTTTTMTNSEISHGFVSQYSRKAPAQYTRIELCHTTKISSSWKRVTQALFHQLRPVKTTPGNKLSNMRDVTALPYYREERRNVRNSTSLTSCHYSTATFGTMAPKAQKEKWGPLRIFTSPTRALEAS